MSLTDFFHEITGGLLSILTQFLAAAKLILKSGGPVLLEIAADAVASAEAAGGSGKDKFAAAQATIIAELTSKGLPIVLNAINAAIEAEVAKLKAA